MMLSHGNADLDAGFEFKGDVIIVDRHPLKELPDKIIVVFLNIRLLGFQKSLDLIEVSHLAWYRAAQEYRCSPAWSSPV